ncbi:hypothetical protein [Thermosediminibacter litoriperuensis]|uniref:hypothetical protein n=1 Tax=Thermosediminibacter litoriperuensis TaxID=291989 RepID=UPI001FE464CF|nr:hypothetical protein [Thermosediminibacter litoriperuensis]
MVLTTSSIDALFFIMVEAILTVRVESILAFTPLPRPSAITAIIPSSDWTTSTLSPHSSSPFFVRLLVNTSAKTFTFLLPCFSPVP